MRFLACALFCFSLLGQSAPDLSTVSKTAGASAAALTDAQRADFLEKKARVFRLQAEYQALVNHEAVKRIIAVQTQLQSLQNDLNAKLEKAGWSLSEDLEFKPAEAKPVTAEAQPMPPGPEVVVKKR